MVKLALFAAIAVACCPTPSPAQDFPQPLNEHEWLKQFEGDWETKMEASAGPGQPEMKCEGTMTSKPLGGFWVVSYWKAAMMGTPTEAVQTIGYDSKKKKYVGTWVDSMTDLMWKYEGTVDPTGKILTLEADGPNFTMPGQTAKFRDVYEFKSPDEIATSSAMQSADGNWVTFMTGTAVRKK
jgi:hypothetical protein